MRNNETAGLVHALAGFCLLSAGDALIKSTGGIWPGTAISLTRYAIGAAGLCVILLLREGPGALRPAFSGIHLLRGFAIAVATCTFFTAIFLMPLVEVTAIGFTSPVLTALLAALFLNEKPRRETWFATLLAFSGVLVVLRPNFIEIGWPALLPLGTAAAFSAVMIANRAVAGTASPLAMQVFIAGWAVPFIAAAALAGHLSGVPQFHIGRPDWFTVSACAIVAISASVGHWLLFLGTTRASASTIAPMSYVQLLAATFFGFTLFGERPDWIAASGMAMIVAAGIYLWGAGVMRERAQVRGRA